MVGRKNGTNLVAKFRVDERKFEMNIIAAFLNLLADRENCDDSSSILADGILVLRI